MLEAQLLQAGVREFAERGQVDRPHQGFPRRRVEGSGASADLIASVYPPAGRHVEPALLIMTPEARYARTRCPAGGGCDLRRVEEEAPVSGIAHQRATWGFHSRAVPMGSARIPRCTR